MSSLSRSVDKAIVRYTSRFSRKPRKRKVNELFLANEIYCLEKKEGVLLKEIDIMKAKVDKDTSNERIVELDHKIAEKAADTEKLLKAITLKRNHIRTQEKLILKAQESDLTNKETSPLIVIFQLYVNRLNDSCAILRHTRNMA